MQKTKSKRQKAKKTENTRNIPTHTISSIKKSETRVRLKIDINTGDICHHFAEQEQITFRSRI